MGYEDFSLIQVLTDRIKEKWPNQPFATRRELKGCSPISKPITSIDYVYYGIEWPCLYVSGDIVFIVKDFDGQRPPAIQIAAADPKFFNKFDDAMEAYLKIIGAELFLP